ncbi:MAG: formate dehydrogenase, partial [Luminiphilus sp.]|nr:formate dehydrogenase [Luminiphilus sp.]
MSIWFVPRDAAARSMGADAVAMALELRGETVIRNGSRGMLWMEPLVERAESRHGERVGWANMTAAQIEAGLPDEQSGQYVGAVEEIDYLARQNRWIYERVGITDPVDPEDYLAHGGLSGLKNALAMSGSEVVQAVTDSGLRGRGGA